MKAPVRIWTHDDPYPEYINFHEARGYIVPYIRADLVDKLKGYAVHDDGCPMGPDCTCGLTETLRKLGE